MSDKIIEAVYDPSQASKPEEFLQPIPVAEIEYWVKHAKELAIALARDAKIARLARELVQKLKATDEWISDSSKGCESDWPVLSAAEYEATKALIAAVERENRGI
jgi:hypothetical protein